MALTANREVDRYVDQEIRRYAQAAGARVFKGGFVGLNTGGYARPLVAGDRFLGIAYEESDNASGGNGDRSVRVLTIGDYQLALSGAALTDIGKSVYASADDTITFTATGNSLIGWVVDRPAANTVTVRLNG